MSQSYTKRTLPRETQTLHQIENENPSSKTHLPTKRIRTISVEIETKKEVTQSIKMSNLHE